MINILDTKYRFVDNPAIIVVIAVILGLGLNFAPAAPAAIIAVLVAVYFWKNQETFVLFLLLYLPFEELVLKVVPDSLYAPARYYWEACLFFYMVGIFFRNTRKSDFSKLKFIDYSIGGFILVWIVSTIINAVSPFDSLQVLRNYVRYVPILYLVYTSRKRDWLVAKVVKLFLIMCTLQAIICIGQAIDDKHLTEVFRPREVVVNGKLIRGEDVQTGTYYTRFTGSFSRSNDLGNYLSFGLCLVVALYTQGRRFKGHLLSFVLILAALILTSSRISWLAAYAGVGAILIGIRHRYRFAYFAVPLASMIILLTAGPMITSDDVGEDFGISNRLLFMFTSDYYETMRDAGRLYALFYVAPAVFKSNPLLGLGPSTFLPISTEMQDKRVFAKAGSLGLDQTAAAFVHDIGYVAVLVQIGLLGLIILISLFLRIGKTAKASIASAKSPFHRATLLAVVGILTALAVQNLACSNLMYRNQALVLWLFCGIALSLSGKQDQ